MPDPHTTGSLPARDVAIAVTLALSMQLRLIAQLGRELDQAADDQLRLFEEAEQHVAYWRTRALDAEQALSSIRAARVAALRKENS